METSSKLKLNLIGLGKFSTEIVEKMFDEEDCIKFVYPKNIANEDLESNENIFDFNDSFNINEIEHTFCFVDGKQGISGIALKLLSNFSSKPITVFYIKQEPISNIEKTNDKISFNVLQEYARSGLFSSIFIFDYDKMHNIVIDNIMNNDSIETFEFDVDNLIIDKIISSVYVYWRLQVEKYLDGNFQNFDSTIYRIHTFSDFKNGKLSDAEIFINTFYNIRYSTSILIIASMKKKMSKKDLQLIVDLKKIAKNTNSKLVILNETNEEAENFVISIIGTNIIQEADYMVDYKE